MTFATMTIVELTLFNIAFISFLQPGFVFNLLRIRDSIIRKVVRRLLLINGFVFLMALFAWSFYFGSRLMLYKNALLMG